ncbi:23S rRNA (adenine(2503)-C(2))-methyltransferase @ tRNA (adenine(37)-C(2))-methyltransferase [hydrothermal vent metagenome]|uniref:23S rRNA (Adenine(2503)-C(2))-methyltransferase @ tRNA (Adenine(37)-C(2))-methyltransferase n=1 Tax=hydrothermal vent metagenome TaxID=652676 RepID=A0A3B1DG77_9ZZZZ
MTSPAFVRTAGEAGVAADMAKKAYRRVFREGMREVGLGRGRVVCSQVAPIVQEESEETSEGVIRKFVQRLEGTGQSTNDRAIPFHDIESVLIPMVGRQGLKSHTLCVSSQVGCAMGCGFCETAQMGLLRSLTPAEIVGQWWAATHERQAKIKNIVFMGMGEPLDNVEAVIRAIEILTDHNGPSVPMSNIMVSTVGKADGLRRLCAQMAEPGWHKLGIAVSINAPNDEIRSQIMPINRATPMAELREAICEIPHVGTHRKICFGYVLIPGVNDAEEHAAELADYLRPFTRDGSPDGSHKGMLNLIPYNPRRDSPWPAPEEEAVERFLGWVRERGVYAKRRRTKGRDTMAACGQLGTEAIRKRRFVGVRLTDSPAGSGG